MSQRPGTARQGSNVNRQQSNTSSTRTSTRHGDNINLAGPPERSRRRDVHQTFIEEGYRDLNPWMQEDEEQQNSDFSLAGTFPHKIRFQGRPQRDQPTQQVYKPGEEKGETEPAPQVAAAEDQQLEQQHSRGSVGRRNEQQQQAREDRVDSNSNVVADAPENGPKSTKFKRRMDAFRPNNTSVGDIADKPTNPLERSYNSWARFRQKYRRMLAEWLGTTILVFIGVSADLAVVTSKQQNGTAMTMFLSWGFAAMLGIYVSGGGSGGFLNPALVVMLSVFRGFPAKRIPFYIIAEVVGAFTGAILALGLYRDNILHLGEGFSPTSTGTYIYTQPQDWITPATAFFNEFLCAAVLGCGILALGDSGNSPPGAGMHAFIIGLLVTTCTIAGSFNTHACLNPARDFGPRLAAMAIGYPTSIFTASHNWWIWGPWCACTTGALTGGLFYDLCVFRGNESPVNYSPLRWIVETRKEENTWLRRFGKHKQADELDRKIEEGLKKVQDEVDL